MSEQLLNLETNHRIFFIIIFFFFSFSSFLKSFNFIIMAFNFIIRANGFLKLNLKFYCTFLLKSEGFF